MTQTPKLLESQKYLDDLVVSINNSTKNVYILAMVIVADDATEDFIEALKNAALRGVEVIISADIFTYTELTGFFLTNSLASKKSRRTNKMVRDLKKSGVKFRWLGVDKMFIFMGRAHTKFSVVDDTCYTFGGINLYEGGVEARDYMIKIVDPTLRKILVSEFDTITKADTHRLLHKSYEIDYSLGKILVDGGMLGGSIIYARAYEHAKDSKRIVYVSQYCPSGRLAKVLARTSNKEVYFNPKQNTNFMNGVINSMGEMTVGLTTDYHNPTYLHAKFIIFYKNDGTTIAITGSHNFSFASVLAGTREIALETADKTIINGLEKFVSKNLKSKN